MLDTMKGRVFKKEDVFDKFGVYPEKVIDVQSLAGDSVDNIPGIPGMLLNEGSITNQDVIVIIFNTLGEGPDFKSSADLCMSMSKLIPGASCDIPSLQKEAEKAEATIKETQEESTHLKDSMYR
jgi:predicted ATP-grasp superfamily ATP-dependent carboligase